MNLDELQSVQSKERQKDSLQHLRPTFYRDVGDYISELKEERDRVAEAADDPFSEPEVSRLTDEIETAKDVVEAVYERRMGKLVKQASLAAAGLPADDEGLTAEEKDLFEDLVDRIRSNKNHVLDVLEEGADAESTASDPTNATPTAPDEPVDGAAADEVPPDQAPAEDATDPSPPPEHALDEGDGVSAADVMGGTVGSDSNSEPSAEPDPSAEPGSAAGSGSSRHDSSRDGSSQDGSKSPRDAPSDPDVPDVAGDENPHDESDDADTPSSGPGSDPSAERDADPSTDGGPGGDVDRVTVRITRDVGSILGIDDREYTLASDDVVTLPEQNATPLVERDAAEPLE